MKRTRYYRKRTIVVFVLLCTVFCPVKANIYWKDANVMFDGYSTGIIRDIQYAQDGIWLGAENGLFRITGQNAERIAFPYPITGYISDLELSKKEELWIAVYGEGIFLKKKNGKVELIEKRKPFESAWQIHDSGKYLVILTIGSVVIYDKRTSEIVRRISGFTESQFKSLPYIYSENGHTLIIEGEGILYADALDGDFREFSLEDVWPRLSTVSHIAYHQENYYIVGPEGVYSGEDIFTQEYYRSSDRPLKNIRLVTTLDDSVSLIGNTLSKLTESRVESVRWVKYLWDEEGLGTVTSATESESGDIYVASSQKGLMYIPTFYDAIAVNEQDGGILSRAFTRVTGGEGTNTSKLYRRQIREICDTGSGKPFCDSQYEIVHAYGADAWLAVSADDGRSEISVYTADWEQSDNLSLDFQIQDLTVSDSGSIYVVSKENDVYVQMSRTSWRKLALSIDRALKFDCFFSAGETQIYLCSKKNGLFFLDASEETISAEQLSAQQRVNYIRGGAADSAGTVWIATNAGLFFKNLSGDWIRLTRPDGIKDVDFEYRGLVASKHALYANGDIYDYQILNTEFTKRIKSRQQRISTPVISVTDKDTGEEILQDSDNVFQFVLGKRKVVMNAFINNYILRNDLELEYSISDGRTWKSTGSTNLSEDLSQLSSGMHTIQLRVNDPRSYAEQPVTAITIHVLPPWWRSWQAMMAYTLALVILGFVGYRSYLRRVDEQGEMLSRMVDEKNTALEDSGTFLNQVLSQKQRIMANLSHEIRTPLSLVIGPLSQMLKAPDDPEMPALLDTANRNANRIRVLVDQMLELEKLDYVRSRPKQHYDLDKDVPKIIYDLKPFAEAKDQTLVVKCSTGKSISLYEDTLEKILNNLVSNAVKYTHTGGNISVRITQRAMQLLIEVSDNGQGIPDEKKEKIFERYTQLDKSKDGVGVGLALVKELVTVNDGHIKLESEVEQGTCVRVWLPLLNTEYEQKAANASVAAGEPHSPGYAVNESAPQEDKLILVVDDNEELRRYLHKQISGQYHCLVADSAKQALDVSARMRPDLILTDFKMPEMDGLELTQEVRERFDDVRIPVIVMSAFGDPQSIRDALAAGADSYLTKPVETELLLLRIRNVLERQQIQTVEISADSFESEVTDLPDFVSEREQNFYFKFMDILEAHHADEHFNKAAMASEMAVSERQLSRVLRTIFDKTFIELLKEFRLERAKQLLAEGKQVTQVGLEVGFSSPSQFSRAFREVNDTTPTQYQQEHAKPARKKS